MSVAIPTPVAALPDSVVEVRYVGPKTVKRDNVAGTSTVWPGYGSVQKVPKTAAAKMMQHPDVWKMADAPYEAKSPWMKEEEKKIVALKNERDALLPQAGQLFLVVRTQTTDHSEVVTLLAEHGYTLEAVVLPDGGRLEGFAKSAPAENAAPPQQPPDLQEIAKQARQAILDVYGILFPSTASIEVLKQASKELEEMQVRPKTDAEKKAFIRKHFRSVEVS